MAIQKVSVFLTPKQGSTNEVELRTFPEPVIANINRDLDSGDLVELDEVVWNYVTQPPPDAKADAVPQPPNPEEVYVEIRFAPRRTPFQPPTSFRSELDESGVEADAAGYGNVGTVTVTPNAPRLDSASALVGETQETDVEGEFEYLVRNYKYTVILTTQDHVYALDPNLKIRSRFRRVV